MRIAIAASFFLALSACGNAHQGPEAVHPVEVALGDTNAHDVDGTNVTVQLVRPGDMSATRPTNQNQASVLVKQGTRQRQITLRAPPGDGVPDSAVALGWRVQLLETVPSPRVRVWPERPH